PARQAVRHRPPLLARAPRRGDQRRCDRRSAVGGARRGGEPAARTEGAAGNAHPAALSAPARQPNRTTAALITASTTMMLIRESVANSARVPPGRPVNARATTGSTGAPQPASEHGPAVNPKTLVAAPSIPTGRLAERPGSRASTCRQYDQGAKYAPNTSDG